MGSTTLPAELATDLPSSLHLPSPCLAPPRLPQLGEPQRLLPGVWEFEQQLARDWARAELFWWPLTLLIIDLDDHSGLRLEGLLAAQLQQFCREVDVAFQLSPTRFAVLMLGTNRTGGQAECCELRQAIEGMVCLHGGNAVLGALSLRMGMAVARDDADTPGELMELAIERSNEQAPAPVSGVRAIAGASTRPWSLPLGFTEAGAVT